MRFYLIGKIGGVKLTPAVIEKFEKFEDSLRKFWIVTDVVNPTSPAVQASIAIVTHNCKNEREAYRRILAHDILLLSQCDAAALLPDWLSSNGAHVECEFCLRAHIPLYVISGETLHRSLIEKVYTK